YVLNADVPTAGTSLLLKEKKGFHGGQALAFYSDGQVRKEEPGSPGAVMFRALLLLRDPPAGWDLQYALKLFAREAAARRWEYSVYGPKTGENALPQFPSRLEDIDRSKPGTDRDNLDWYDVVIAFDPYWTELGEAAVKRLSDWVGRRGGGLVVAAGP